MKAPLEFLKKKGLVSPDSNDLFIRTKNGGIYSLCTLLYEYKEEGRKTK